MVFELLTFRQVKDRSAETRPLLLQFPEGGGRDASPAAMRFPQAQQLAAGDSIAPLSPPPPHHWLAISLIVCVAAEGQRVTMAQTIWCLGNTLLG